MRSTHSKVTIIEPAPFVTDFSGSSMNGSAPISVDELLRHQLAGMLNLATCRAPETGMEHVLKVVDADHPPLHLLFGMPRPVIDSVCAACASDWDTLAGTNGARVDTQTALMTLGKANIPAAHGFVHSQDSKRIATSFTKESNNETICSSANIRYRSGTTRRF